MASSVVGVDVASSTDPVRDVDFSGMYDVTCKKDGLAPSGCVRDGDDLGEMVPSGKRELGRPTDVVPPIVGKELAVATMIRRESDLSIVRAPGSTAVLPADEDFPEEEHEVIMVEAIGTGPLGS